MGTCPGTTVDESRPTETVTRADSLGKVVDFLNISLDSPVNGTTEDLAIGVEIFNDWALVGLEETAFND